MLFRSVEKGIDIQPERSRIFPYPTLYRVDDSEYTSPTDLSELEFQTSSNEKKKVISEAPVKPYGPICEKNSDRCPLGSHLDCENIGSTVSSIGEHKPGCLLSQDGRLSTHKIAGGVLVHALGPFRTYQGTTQSALPLYGSLHALNPEYLEPVTMTELMQSFGGERSFLGMMHGPRLAPIVDAFREKLDRKSTRLNSSHVSESRMPSSA